MVLYGKVTLSFNTFTLGLQLSILGYYYLNRGEQWVFKHSVFFSLAKVMLV